MGATALSAQNPLATELKQQWAATKDPIMKSADRMAEADYSFKPAAGNTRTFAQVIGHIADIQLAVCGAAKGEQKRGNAEMTAMTKSEATAALKASNDYCDSAYDPLTDAAATEQIRMFGGMRSRLSALYFNIIHDNEMYGEIVVYYRAKGMVPPTTADRPAMGKK
jgi:xanthine dehydrogenase iron-sulfur cluster and FAD-binding subunit A